MGKDPNAPKRNLSAYMMFCNAKRAGVVKKNPTLKMVQISPIIAEMWRNASAAEKKPFEQKAAKAKAAYQVKLAKYQQTAAYANFKSASGASSLLKDICKKHGIEAPRGKKAKFPKDPKAPKRASSSFFLWANDNRPRLMKKHKNDVSAVGKALGVEWKTVSADVRAKYQTQADKAKSKYESKMNAYKKTASFKKFEAARKEFTKMKKKL